jgi:hypothetical protein
LSSVSRSVFLSVSLSVSIYNITILFNMYYNKKLIY